MIEYGTKDEEAANWENPSDRSLSEFGRGPALVEQASEDAALRLLDQPVAAIGSS
jgi:hypothetical protein